MKQCLLHIEPLGVTLSADRGTSLYEVLKNCHLEFPCGGKGLCGNCKVRILSGQVEKTEVHRAFLERKHLSSEWCLACLTVLTEDLTIEIPEGAMDIQTDESEITGNGGKCRIHNGRFPAGGVAYGKGTCNLQRNQSSDNLRSRYHIPYCLCGVG